MSDLDAKAELERCRSNDQVLKQVCQRLNVSSASEALAKIDKMKKSIERYRLALKEGDVTGEANSATS